MKELILTCLLLVLPATLWGNGSPINSTEIYGTGNIEMIKKKNISLDTEFVSVVIDGDYANVKVEYKFTNHGPVDRVTYGFPVDLYFTESGIFPEKSLTDFKIEDETGVLKVQSYSFSEPTDPDSLYKRMRKWIVTEILFAKEQPKTVKVSYRIKSRLDDWVYTKSFRPQFSNRTFTYMMKPSQNWGNGVVKSCTIEVDVRKILQSQGILKEIHPQRDYIEREGILTWKYSNFGLANAEDIQIVYDNSAMALTEYIAKERVPLKFIKSVKASSVLKTDAVNKFNYEPKNLFDDNFDTAWVEGVEGNGEGEWVEIEVDDDVFINAIGIINGYTKREPIYYANNRIAKIKLEFEDKPGSMIDYQPLTEISLLEKQFNKLNRDVEAPFISWLADYGDGARSGGKIRLTILDVYAGKKYRDSCISELYFLGYWPGKE